MGIFDRFLKSDADRVARAGIVGLVFAVLRDGDGRIHVEDAISAAATIVGERCIDAAGDFPLRNHDLTPGSRAFSTRANELICGDASDVRETPAKSVVGVLRTRLDSKLYLDAEFPDLSGVFKNFAARIGDPADWGRVPLSVPEVHWPFLLPLRIGYETRARVDDILASVRSDKVRCLRIATESLADILTQVASALDHRIALTLAIETINGMAKTAPMTEAAMRARDELRSSAGDA